MSADEILNSELFSKRLTTCIRHCAGPKALLEDCNLAPR